MIDPMTTIFALAFVFGLAFFAPAKTKRPTTTYRKEWVRDLAEPRILFSGIAAPGAYFPDGFDAPSTIVVTYTFSDLVGGFSFSDFCFLVMAAGVLATASCLFYSAVSGTKRSVLRVYTSTQRILMAATAALLIIVLAHEFPGGFGA